MKKQRYKYHSGLECLHCNEKIFSMSRHRFIRCKCKQPNGVYVDGGFSYLRCGYAVGWQLGKDFKIIRKRIYEPKKNS